MQFLSGLSPGPEYLFPRSAQLGYPAEVVFEIELRYFDRWLHDDRCHITIVSCSRPPTSDPECSLVPVQRSGIPDQRSDFWYCAIQISSMAEDDIGVYQVCLVDLSYGHCHENSPIHINFAACKYTFCKVKQTVVIIMIIKLNCTPTHFFRLKLFLQNIIIIWGRGYYHHGHDWPLSWQEKKKKKRKKEKKRKKKKTKKKNEKKTTKIIGGNCPPPGAAPCSGILVLPNW